MTLILYLTFELIIKAFFNSKVFIIISRLIYIDKNSLFNLFIYFQQIKNTDEYNITYIVLLDYSTKYILTKDYNLKMMSHLQIIKEKLALFSHFY